MISRRSILSAFGGLVAAPAIVRLASIMPVKSWQSWHGLSIYDNRTIRVYLDVNAMRDRNVLLRLNEFVGVVAPTDAETLTYG